MYFGRAFGRSGGRPDSATLHLDIYHRGLDFDVEIASYGTRNMTYLGIIILLLVEHEALIK